MLSLSVPVVETFPLVLIEVEPVIVPLVIALPLTLPAAALLYSKIHPLVLLFNI